MSYPLPYSLTVLSYILYRICLSIINCSSSLLQQSDTDYIIIFIILSYFLYEDEKYMTGTESKLWMQNAYISQRSF